MLKIFILGASVSSHIIDSAWGSIDSTFELRDEIDNGLLLGLGRPRLKSFSIIFASIKCDTHSHKFCQSVNFTCMSWGTIGFVGFGFTNSAEIFPLHADMGCKFTRHRIITLESQEPRNDQNPLFVLAVPDFDPILLSFPINILATQTHQE
jgi:hypothetical protein